MSLRGKLPGSRDRHLWGFLESVGLEMGTGPGMTVSVSGAGLGGCGDELDTEGGGEESDLRGGAWGVAVSGPRNGGGGCLEAWGAGGEKDRGWGLECDLENKSRVPETRSSENVLVSSLSSAGSALVTGTGITRVGEARTQS